MQEYIKVAAATPSVHIAAPFRNAQAMLNLAKKHKDCHLIVFPELSITGYSCADLFAQNHLLQQAVDATFWFAKELHTMQFAGMAVIGVPLKADNTLFNCAVFIQSGRIVAVIPKQYLPNYKEFYEQRWFSPAQYRKSQQITLLSSQGEMQQVPFGEDLLICDPTGRLVLSADICEDLWTPIPPSSLACMAGANVIVNLSASNETIAKQDYRRDLVRMQSARCICAYLYASAGQQESTTDLVFSGHRIICANGSILAEDIFPEKGEQVITAIVDLQQLDRERQMTATFVANTQILPTYRKIVVTDLGKNINSELERQLKLNPLPFVSENWKARNRRCAEIAKIQATGLAQRLQKTGMEKLVIGMSGGLDSTLAFLVAVDAMRQLQLPLKNILGVTMPCVGTTSRTRSNAEILVKGYGADFLQIDIKEACKLHLRDIGHAEDVYDIAFENTQARERTQILMDLANMHHALVVGTGDLSELALGWCTYNGDHMSMYAVNSSIPKTLVKTLVQWHAQQKQQDFEGLQQVLEDILDTPISPELLPVSDIGEMQQKTEDTIGKYDLHDFFLFYMLRYGFDPAKILRLAKIAYPNIEPAYIQKTLKTFYSRFFTQQFKRSCLPDGVKVGSVALSPRGDWRMPSDADVTEFLKMIE